MGASGGWSPALALGCDRASSRDLVAAGKFLALAAVEAVPVRR